MSITREQIPEVPEGVGWIEVKIVYYSPDGNKPGIMTDYFHLKREPLLEQPVGTVLHAYHRLKDGKPNRGEFVPLGRISSIRRFTPKFE